MDPGSSRYTWFRNAAIGRIGLFLFAIIACIIWSEHLADRELWHDEASSIFEAHGLGFDGNSPQQGFRASDLPRWNTLRNVLSTNAFIDSGNGSLFVSALHYWILLLGNSLATMRCMSVLFGLISIYLMYKLGQLTFGDRLVAITGAALLVLSPLLGTLAVESRSYTMALTFSLGATLQLMLLLRAERIRPWSVLIYGLLGGASLLAHYSTCYILAAHPLLALLERADWKRMLRILPGGLLAIGCLLLWMGNGGLAGLGQMELYNQYYVDLVTSDPNGSTFFTAATPSGIAEGLATQALWMTGNSLQFVLPRFLLAAFMLLIPLSLVAWAWRSAAHDHSRRRVPGLILLTSATLVYALVLALTSGHTVSFQPRYALFSMPYALLALAWAMITFLRDRTSWSMGRSLVVIHFGVVLCSMIVTRGSAPQVAPNRYVEHGLAVERLILDHPGKSVRAVHRSKAAAYLCALYLPTSAADIQHYIVPELGPVSALVIDGSSGSILVPIRSSDPRYERSEPIDDAVWQLDYGPAPALP